MKTTKRYQSSTDVARLAGVSQSAVSRSFSKGKGGVSEETRRKVFEAAKVLGYSPNFIPRILLNHRSKLVAIVISGAQNPFYSLVLEEFTMALQEIGHQALLVHVDSRHSLDGIVPRLASYRVDAIVSALPILAEAAAAEFVRIGIPIVSFNTPIKNQWVSSVCSDNAGGGRQVAELFVRRGARSFGFVAGSARSHAGKERLRGFRNELSDRGFPELVISSGDYTYEGGFNAAAEMAARGNVPEALFCANDLMALGALDAFKLSARLRVPDDVMIAGYDDVPTSSWKSYDLTTVVQDGPTMVAVAMSVLQAMISDSSAVGGIRRVVPARLVERASTRRSSL
jgi:DNA-binding LacI/PurR family transcriptional regulator